MRQTKRHELFWYPDTYDVARGLVLGGHSSSPSSALVEKSGGRVLPFLDPPASSVGEAFLFFSPPTRGEASFFSSSSSREESASSHRTMSPITPDAGNSFGFPWPSSWPSSPAPHKAPEPAAPLIGHPLGLLAREPDS